MTRFQNFFLSLYTSLLAIAAMAVQRVEDALTGDVNAALTQFQKVEAKLDRARMATIRRANKVDAQIEALYDRAEALEDAYDANIAAAERAARVQKRISQLLG